MAKKKSEKKQKRQIQRADQSRGDSTLTEEQQAAVDQQIRIQRHRVAKEMAILGKGMTLAQRRSQGLLLGDALKICKVCRKETILTSTDAKREGWKPVIIQAGNKKLKPGERDWLCPKCVEEE